MNSIRIVMLHLVNRATLSGYIFAFAVWIIYNNMLSNLVYNIALFPKFRFSLNLAAYVCKVGDPTEVIGPFIGFALLKFVGLIVLFFLLRTNYLKILHDLFRYLLAVEFTCSVLFILLHFASAIHPFEVDAYFFAADPFHFFFFVHKMGPWPGFALVGIISAFLLNRLGLLAAPDIILKVVFTSLSYFLCLGMAWLWFGHI